MTDAIGFKACPFCSGEACLKYMPFGWPSKWQSIYVVCTKCHSSSPASPLTSDSEPDENCGAIQGWNERALRLTPEQKALIYMRLHYNHFAGKEGSWIEEKQLMETLDNLEW